MNEHIYWKIFLSYVVALALSVLMLGFFQYSALSITVILIIITAYSTYLASFFLSNIDRLSDAIFDISMGRYKPNILKTNSEFRRIEDSIERLQDRIVSTMADLSSSQAKVKAMLSSMVECMIAVGPGGHVIAVNPAFERMFSVLEPEILNKPIREAIRNNEIVELIEEASAGNRAVHKEIHIVLPFDGLFMAHANPISGDENAAAGAVCVLYDMTEIRKLETYRSEFVANVSHELKTPLTVIKGNVDTLLEGAINDKEHNLEFLKKIGKHTMNLSALIDDILEISNLESKVDLGTIGRVDVGMEAIHAIDTVTDKIKNKKIILERDVQEGGLFISGIEDHVYRAILNILDNAVNYTNDGGKVSIVCRKNGPEVEVVVSDTGIGIPEKDVPRLFERFYRVDKSRSRDVGGTGLGLAIVKHIMEIHNGKVTVESEEGVGSTFTLKFPA
jgi:two-component system phosphate regulon sensor histidine kinase PhoR